MREDVGACDVDVVGACEGLAQRDGAAQVLEVEGGSGVVDEDVEMAWIRGDGVEGGGDGVVAGEVDLQGGDGVGVGWTRGSLVQAVDGLGGFVDGARAEEDVVGFQGREQSFDSFVADAAVAAGDEDDFGGRCHGCTGAVCSDTSRGQMSYVAACV